MSKKLYYIISKIFEVRIPLVEEIICNRIYDVKLAINNRQNLDFAYLYDRSSYVYPLTLAVLLEKYELVRLMLEYGGNSNYIIQENRRSYQKTILCDPKRHHITQDIESKLCGKFGGSSITVMQDDGWLVTPMTLAFFKGNLFLLQMMYNYGGRLKHRYQYSLMKYFFKNKKILNRHICTLLVQYREFSYEQKGEHQNFSDLIERLYERVKKDVCWKCEFEECVKLLVQYGFRYLNKGRVAIFESSQKLIRILKLEKDFKEYQRMKFLNRLKESRINFGQSIGGTPRTAPIRNSVDFNRLLKKSKSPTRRRSMSDSLLKKSLLNRVRRARKKISKSDDEEFLKLSDEEDSSSSSSSESDEDFEIEEDEDDDDSSGISDGDLNYESEASVLFDSDGESSPGRNSDRQSTTSGDSVDGGTSCSVTSGEGGERNRPKMQSLINRIKISPIIIESKNRTKKKSRN